MLSQINAKYTKPSTEDKVWKITQHQVEILLTCVSYDQLMTILGREEIYLHEISKSEYLRILSVTGLRKFSAFYCDHVISLTPDYEYGWQDSDKCKSNRMYYLRFYDIMMMDFDNRLVSTDNIEKICFSLELSARLYSTRNGYHVFITSERIHHSKSRIIASEFEDADIYYTAFSKSTGYKVRLNPKVGRDEVIASVYVCRLNIHVEEQQEILDLIAKCDEMQITHAHL